MAETAVPSISRPATVPLPCVSSTVLAVTAPSNKETEATVSLVPLQPAPLTLDEPKAITDAEAG
jgi:hypothetical protein